MNSTSTAAPSPALPAQGEASLLDRLRAETAQQHRELEGIVDIAQRLSSRDAYRELLAQFYGFYHPLELRLAASAAAETTIGTGRLEKGRWLAEDLAELGVRDVSPLPLCRLLPAVDSRAQALGTMYVLEGSTLGGRHISALLNADANARMPQRFFASYGSEVGARWRSFCAILNELTAPHDQEAATENARATFDCMRVWMASHQ